MLSRCCCLGPLEDVINFFITIGSPALAAYSLQITHLNASWLSRAFLDVDHRNSRPISTVFSAFQHVPIQVSSTGASLLSLIVLPQNDPYWELLLKGAEKTRRWSVPLVVGFVWVVVATLLTIIDSFYSPPTDDVGYSMVATWTYLLPLIMGWLYVGSQPEPNHLRECLDRANQIAWVTTRDGPRRVEAVDGQESQAIELSKRDGADRARMDEMKTVPVFNYARAFTWSLQAQHVLSLAKSAAAKEKQRITVDNCGPESGVASVRSEKLSTANANRIGTEEQNIGYCAATASTSFGSLPLYTPGSESRWAPGIWERTTLAALFALGLQWGTTWGAIIIHYWSPPVGLGCHSMSFLLYSVASTASMWLCLTGTILAHAARPNHSSISWSSWPQSRLGWGAVICGYLGKGLASASGIGIMIFCFLQSSGALTNCFCASTTFDKGVSDVFFMAINYTIGPDIIRMWIGGLVLAFSTALLFGFSLYLGTPPRR